MCIDVVKPGQILLKPGDKVKVNLTLEDFKKLQNSEINRWSDDMQKVSVPRMEDMILIGVVFPGRIKT